METLAPYLIAAAAFAAVLAWWINRKPATPDEPNDETIDAAAKFDAVKTRYLQLSAMKVGVFKGNSEAGDLIDKLIAELSEELLP